MTQFFKLALCVRILFRTTRRRKKRKLLHPLNIESKTLTSLASISRVRPSEAAIHLIDKMETNTSDLASEIKELKGNLDEVFLITMGIFLCLMQAGFALLEAGSVRSKNVTNIMMKNVMDIFISCLSYWLIGYALAYGDGDSFIGKTYFAGISVPEHKMAHWFFQFIFAATAATIVSGAVAERCNFIAYIIYSAVISGFIYPVVSHWVWSENGWLVTMGYSDFAGSGAVHLLGGTCSLVGAALLGPRIGRFQGKEMPGHSVALTGLGGMILIAGFLAFNGGSLGNMTSPRAGVTISAVIANTVMGGTGAALCVMVLSRFGVAGVPAWSFTVTLNASLTGMVATCASVDQFMLWSAFVVGCLAGPVFVFLRHAVPYFKVDDPLDAIAVHFGGGLMGLITGPFFKNAGIIYSPTLENFQALGYNMIGAVAIFLWSGSICFIMFGILRWLNCLRISEEAELSGLDMAKHNEPAYPHAGWEGHFFSTHQNPNTPGGKFLAQDAVN